jgi:hypothetical protein
MRFGEIVCCDAKLKCTFMRVPMSVHTLLRTVCTYTFRHTQNKQTNNNKHKHKHKHKHKTKQSPCTHMTHTRSIHYPMHWSDMDHQHPLSTIHPLRTLRSLCTRNALQTHRLEHNRVCHIEYTLYTLYTPYTRTGRDESEVEDAVVLLDELSDVCRTLTRDAARHTERGNELVLGHSGAQHAQFSQRYVRNGHLSQQ